MREQAAGEMDDISVAKVVTVLYKHGKPFCRRGGGGDQSRHADV